MSFSQAISGINAASNNLDVIGNNIANSATVGFKASSVTFGDMFAGSQIGMGVQVATVTQNFSNGTVTSSSRDLDVAISSGAGFYRMQDTNGTVYYGRNGQFLLNGRNIVNAQGMQLTGYPAVGAPPVIQTGGDPQPLSIPDGDMFASATTAATLMASLKSSDSKPATAWRAADSTVSPPVLSTEGQEGTFNTKTSLTAYDSQGNKHDFTLYFVKTDDNTWQTYARDASAASPKYQDVGTLKFGSNGALISQSPTPVNGVTPGAFTVDLVGTNGAATGTFTLDFTGSVQQNTDYSYKSPTQNGYAPGALTGFKILEDGTIEGSYNNGQKQALGQIVLAGFANPGGLSPNGDNVWTETVSSGQAVVGTAGTGNLGKLIGKSTEASNVDMGQELVNMIVAQRNYQSNAQTIKTQDSILQTLVSMR
ncbi:MULTISPECIES: flagellar hook protein FlgE [Pectobacterium]|uniref:flagellar hook protein FlgE n=1 Tax=Pectobacterium TaxID=122277 RepID=UPI0015DEDED6|nr:flagellar hook protein FlgE [Pectobacterium sp. CFBP8739]MBA0167912.1 flagellar hook protein FlgE [Pectobacterium sp. CFBP8739]